MESISGLLQKENSVMTKEELKKLFSKPDWTEQTINEADKIVSRIAKEYLGLSTYPNQFEIVTSEQMLDAYSLIGLPISYNHWKFGKDFVMNSNQYKKGRMGLALELVINSNPCISYNMEDNTTCQMILVLAHAAYGHNAHFKNNYLFKQWTQADAIVDYMVFARDFIHKCEEKYGFEEVEQVLDACHALMNYGVDKYKKPKRISASEEQERLKKRLEDDRILLNDLWRTIPKDEKERLKEKRFPESPEENILYFIEKNSPTLRGWQREIVRIVRKTAQYFYPQGQCLVGGSYISTKDGLVKIEDLIQNDGYYESSVDLLSIDNKFETTSHFYKRITNKTIRIKTKLGKTIEGTPEHPIMTINEDLTFSMKRLSDFKIGQFIVNKIGYLKSFSENNFKIELKFTEKNKFVNCQICQREFGNLSTHIPTHGLSVGEYKNKYSTSIISDRVLYDRSGDVRIPTEVNENIARLFGYFISEGSWIDHSFSIFNKDKNIIDDVNNILKSEFNIDANISYFEEKDGYNISIYNSKFFEILKYCGLNNTKSYYKEIPKSILQGNKLTIINFLKSLFEGDGCNTSDGQIQYSTRSKTLSNQVQLLLQCMGIVSKIQVNEIDYEYKIDVPHKNNYKVIVLGHFYKKYMDVIGFTSDRKNKYNQMDNLSLNTFGVPYLNEKIKELRLSIDKTTSKNKINRRDCLPVSRSIDSFKWDYIESQKEEFEYIKNINESEYLIIKSAINTENYYDEILSIEILEGDKWVYDVTIPSNHLFISDGYVSHNTKVINEGTATHAHYEIINKMYEEGYLGEDFMLEFLHNHSNVIYQPGFDSQYYSGLNPYTLGFNIFQDLKRMSLNPTKEDLEWFPNLAGKGDWIEQFGYIVENFKDETFVLQYLSPKVIRDMKLFRIDDSSENSYYEVSAIHNETGYKKVRQALSENYNRSRYVPDIQVYSVDVFGDRTLTLEYTPESNKGLDYNELRKVAPYVEFLWGFPVRITESGKEIHSTKKTI